MLRAAFEAIKVTVASRRYTWPGLHVKPQHKGCQCPRLSESDSLHLKSYITDWRWQTGKLYHSLALLRRHSSVKVKVKQLDWLSKHLVRYAMLQHCARTATFNLKGNPQIQSQRLGQLQVCSSHRNTVVTVHGVQLV